MKEEKYVEDLLNEKDIDVIAVLNAKFRHPYRTFFWYHLFKFKVYLKDFLQRIKFFIKKILKDFNK